MNKDKIGGLIFLVFSFAYAYVAWKIPSLPGEDMESITPRTLPFSLSILGVVFSLSLIIKSTINPQTKITETVSLKTYDWKLTLLLLALMLLYGLMLTPLGFLPATWLFLFGGFYLMGERRIKILLMTSVPLVLIFWGLLTQVLDVFLETGTLWN